MDTGVTNQFDECDDEVSLRLTRNNGETLDQLFALDQEDRSFTIETDDRDLDQMVFKMILTAKNKRIQL